MRITDDKISSDAGIGMETVLVPCNPAISLTTRQFGVIRPGFPFYVESVAVSCSTIAGTVTVNARIIGADGIITAPTFSVHSTPEQLAATISRFRVGGRYVEKAAATGITFTAAHVVSASKFGVILIQTDNAGTLSTKVPSATQAYDTAALAVAALPAADSARLALGYVIIAADGTTWTANTDDLTNGSDLTTATFVSVAAVGSLMTGAITPVGFERVAGTMTTTRADRFTRDATKDILLTVTTNGSGALTNGIAAVRYRPYPMHSEV